MRSKIAQRIMSETDRVNKYIMGFDPYLDTGEGSSFGAVYEILEDGTIKVLRTFGGTSSVRENKNKM